MTTDVVNVALPRLYTISMLLQLLLLQCPPPTTSLQMAIYTGQGLPHAPNWAWGIPPLGGLPIMVKAQPWVWPDVWCG